MTTCPGCQAALEKHNEHFGTNGHRSFWDEIVRTYKCCALYPEPGGTTHKDHCDKAGQRRCFALLRHARTKHPEEWTLKVLQGDFAP